MTSSANGNVIDAPSDWHAVKWDEGLVRIASIIRPSDRRPWAMLWCAIYPNEDVIAFQEWPDFDFNACGKSPLSHAEDYRQVIIEYEKVIGREIDMRFIHPDFAGKKGHSIVRSVRQVLGGCCRSCWRVVNGRDFEDIEDKSEAFQKASENCKHKLSFVAWPEYAEAVRDGNMRIRTAIGDSASGRRPKLYVIKHACPNLIFSMQNHAWSDEIDPTSEKVEESGGEFVSLLAGGYLKRFNEWPEEMPPMAPPPIIKTIPGHKGWGMQGRT